MHEWWVREPCSQGKNYIFANTWNKTHTLKFSSKMHTGGIMGLIQMKTGDPKKQQCVIHQSKQPTTRQTLKYYNIQEIDTVVLSLELHCGTGMTEPTEQPTLDR